MITEKEEQIIEMKKKEIKEKIENTKSQVIKDYLQGFMNGLDWVLLNC